MTRSHIANGLSVTGDMVGDIDLLLDGKLEGNLRCRAVTIGKSGELVGRIVAQEVVIDGTVIGDVEAKIVRLNVTAVMSGDVCHGVIEVAAGAKIEGRYSRIDEKSESKTLSKPGSGTKAAKTPALVDNETGIDPEKPVGEVVAMETPAKVG